LRKSSRSKRETKGGNPFLVVLERLVIVGDHVVEDLVGDNGFKLCSGGEFHAPLSDSVSLEVVGGSDVEGCDEIVYEG
jgi:hypothetical protein